MKEREQRGSFGGALLDLESVSKEHPLGNAFFYFLLPTPGIEKGLPQQMVMGLGLTRKFWNFASGCCFGIG
jgi:hypothetical protein